MKRTLAIILVLAMLVCMLPAFSLGITAEEPEQNISGLNAQLYQLKGLESAFNWDSGLLDNIIPNAWSNESCSYDDALHFEQRYQPRQNQ